MCHKYLLTTTPQRTTIFLIFSTHSNIFNHNLQNYMSRLPPSATIRFFLVFVFFWVLGYWLPDAPPRPSAVRRGERSAVDAFPPLVALRRQDLELRAARARRPNGRILTQRYDQKSQIPLLFEVIRKYRKHNAPMSKSNKDVLSV